MSPLNYKLRPHTAFNGDFMMYTKLRPTLSNTYELNCVIRGVYFNFEFAKWCRECIKNREIIITPKCPEAPSELKAAINASHIINDAINGGDIPFPDCLPYCIWYPHFAKEDTYRQLAKKYPLLKYQVARACVIADYRELYRELNVLTEINIIAEAYYLDNRSYFLENINKCMYAVMDDSTSTIYINSEKELDLKPRTNCFGNTCVYSEIEKSLCSEFAMCKCYNGPYFNLFNLVKNSICINEDYCTHTPLEPKTLYSDESIQTYKLLTLPKYESLPTFINRENTNLLIIYTAYNADIDRFKILLDNDCLKFSSDEGSALMNGIRENYNFAKWCLHNLPLDRFINVGDTLREVINASYIINDDLNIPFPNHITNRIWYPRFAKEDTYRQLYNKYPHVKVGIAKACVVAGYKNLYNQIGVDVDTPLYDHDKYFDYHVEGMVDKQLSVFDTNLHHAVDCTSFNTEELDFDNHSMSLKFLYKKMNHIKDYYNQYKN